MPNTRRPADPLFMRPPTLENRSIMIKATICPFRGVCGHDEGEVAAAVPGQIAGVPGQCRVDPVKEPGSRHGAVAIRFAMVGSPRRWEAAYTGAW
jgi:hypothetical protein